MNRRLLPLGLAALLLGTPLHAAASHDRVFVPLFGYEEVPAVSTQAIGFFRAEIDRQAGTIEYELAYDALAGEVRQAHIHFGQKGVNGGISVFLCQTATNPDPTGLAPACSAPPARIVGMLSSANIIGPAGQGIAATELGELLAAIRSGVAYVNVHSSSFTGGEIRGQFDRRGR
jgi:hypothetical protein